MYTPKELADEIGIHKNQFYYAYVPLGCPLERDKYNHIFINGKSFALWYTSVYAKLRLAPNETFCRTCKSAVEIYQPKYKTKDNLSYVLSVCSACGRNLTKIIALEKR